MSRDNLSSFLVIVNPVSTESVLLSLEFELTILPNSQTNTLIHYAGVP